MNDFEFDAEELAQLREMFFEQAQEVIDSLGGLILQIERDPSDSECLRSIRRAVHTLKGDSTAFGFTDLIELAHRYEDALDRLYARKEAASRELIDLLLAGSDALGAILQHYRVGTPLPAVDEIIGRLSILVDAGSVDAPATAGAVPRADVEKAEPAASAPETPTEPVQQEAAAAGPANRATTLRVESERIDVAMNLVGELIIQRSMVATFAAELDARHPNDETTRGLVEALALSARTLTELQESVMRMRLVAIDQVFKRFPRVVRDASNKLGKPIRVEIRGGQTEIDKSVVEVISDPLIHLVRNACDHGIESPAKRAAAGKPDEGVVRISARRVGNRIVVEVEDDGPGVDAERVVSKAIERGIVSAADVASWSEQEKVALIFLPGFSTADQVSEMSGRGVGMDVVKTTVEAIGGTVSVTSVPGSGSRFTIKLPLTMAIVRAMLFEVANRRFALPLDAVREITRLAPGDAKTVNGREVLRIRDRVIPIVRVGEALDLTELSARDQLDRRFVFVLELGDGRDACLVVDRLLGEQELVLKSVDDALSRSPVVAGASILGDGSVVFILDPLAVLDRARQKEWVA